MTMTVNHTQASTGQHVITTRTILVTPAMAAEMLTHNTHNRPMSKRRVDLLAQAMRDGRWHPTHQGVAFGSDGTLTDGQHRLAAIVASGVSLTMPVSYGVDHFEVIDTGRARGASDVLAIEGFKNAGHLAAALRLHLCYESGKPRSWAELRKTFTPASIQDAARIHGEDMAKSLIPGARAAVRIGGSKSAFTAALYIAGRWAEDGGIPEQFIDWEDGLVSGAGLADGDPRLALHSWVSNAARTLGSSDRTELTMLLTLRAFHAHVVGERLAKLIVRGPANYLFRLPEIS